MPECPLKNLTFRFTIGILHDFFLDYFELRHIALSFLRQHGVPIKCVTDFASHVLPIFQVPKRMVQGHRGFKGDSISPPTAWKYKRLTSFKHCHLCFHIVKIWMALHTWE